MNFIETGLGGAYLIQPERSADERGFFMRTWCRREFEERGLNSRLVQCNLSYNRLRGTLRGIHYQAEPHQEAKLVRCTRGAVYDVIIDLRPGSRTRTRHFGVVLGATDYQMLYVPEGFGHGFLTLEDETEVFYQMSEFHVPEAARGVRWNDRVFGIQWPGEVTVISDRDRAFPDFDPSEAGGAAGGE